jgi:hypothetical protein
MEASLKEEAVGDYTRVGSIVVVIRGLGFDDDRTMRGLTYRTSTS